MIQVAVIGTGYVGLSTGACLAALGHQVVCLDIDNKKVDTLNRGQIPIVEDGLLELVQEGLSQSRLSFTTSREEAIVSADIVFLCLPTPQGDDGSADLTYVIDEVTAIRYLLKSRAILVNKSTVPVGTARMLKGIIDRQDISVISNPEFLRQGSAVRDFLNPSRVVIGGDNQVAIDVVANLYSKIDAPILRMNTASAETLKYAANAFLATKLTFINAIADLCELVGADIFEVATGIGLDPRIGSDMLRAGPGWGGSCFPKDTRALVKIGEDHGYEFELLRGVIETNDKHYVRIAERIKQECKGQLKGVTVAAWGLTFKAGTDDLRDSPAIKILAMLKDSGAIIRAYDPTAKGPYQQFPWIEVCDSALDACLDADVLAVLTEWPEFQSVKPTQVVEVMKYRRIVDGRNHLNREIWKECGFSYSGVGR